MTFGKAEAASLERPIKAPNQLLVEGKTSEMFFRELIAHERLADRIDVRSFGSIQKEHLQTYLEVFSQKPDFKNKVRSLGIVRDAEEGTAEDAFRSVSSALTDAHLEAPPALFSFSQGEIKTGIFILPDNNSSGMLENLVLDAATESDPAGILPCVDSFLACLERGNIDLRITAKIRTAGYLLGKGLTEPLVGRAAQKNAIPWTARAFQPVNTFLRELTGPVT